MIDPKRSSKEFPCAVPANRATGIYNVAHHVRIARLNRMITASNYAVHNSHKAIRRPVAILEGQGYIGYLPPEGIHHR